MKGQMKKDKASQLEALASIPEHHKELFSALTLKWCEMIDEINAALEKDEDLDAEPIKNRFMYEMKDIAEAKMSSWDQVEIRKSLGFKIIMELVSGFERALTERVETAQSGEPGEILSALTSEMRARVKPVEAP